MDDLAQAGVCRCCLARAAFGISGSTPVWYSVLQVYILSRFIFSPLGDIPY